MCYTVWHYIFRCIDANIISIKRNTSIGRAEKVSKYVGVRLCSTPTYDRRIYITRLVCLFVCLLYAVVAKDTSVFERSILEKGTKRKHSVAGIVLASSIS